MAYETLLARIQERQKALGLSEREMLRRAGVGEKVVYYIKRGHAPKPAVLAKLATGTGVTPSYLLDAAGFGATQPELQPAFVMESVFVKGAVQAGVWREALEWGPSDWYSVNVPISKHYPRLQRYGLEVRGSSMNELYPEGTIVLVVSFDALGRMPRTGEKVVVVHRSKNGEGFEATLKEYERADDGRHILWPRSTDPDHQTPIVLGPDLPLSTSLSHLPGDVRAGRGGLDELGVGDISVAALVVSIYRDET